MANILFTYLSAYFLKVHRKDEQANFYQTNLVAVIYLSGHCKAPDQNQFVTGEQLK